MIDTLLNIIAPHVCVVCGDEGELLCNSCGKKCISANSECFFCDTTLADGEICAACQNKYLLAGLTSVGWYQHELKEVIYAYKFGNKRGGARSLARLLTLATSVNSQSIVTYIPTTALHVRERGFDHAKLLAQSFAAQTNLPCVAALARTNNHRQLGGNKKARQSTVVGSFAPVHSSLYKGKDVIVIDDVVTTGSTLSEAARVLLTFGANSVSALVIAKTPSKARPNR